MNKPVVISRSLSILSNISSSTLYLKKLGLQRFGLFASTEKTMSIFVYQKRPLSDDDEKKINVRKSFDLNTLILPALIHTRIETTEIS